MQKKHALTKAASFGLSFLLVLEVATRVEQRVRFDAPLWGTYTYNSRLFTTDRFGRTGQPYGAYEQWHMNNYGMRGPDVARDKPAGTLRIVVLRATETKGTNAAT